MWDLFNNTLQAYDEYGRRTGKDFMTAELETFLADLRKVFPEAAFNGKTIVK